MKKKSSLLRGVGMTTLFLTLFGCFRLLLIMQKENIDAFIGLGDFIVALSFLTILISLLLCLLNRRKEWLLYSIDVFMLVGGGVFTWKLSDWEGDILLYTGVVIFLIIISCMISVFRFKGDSFDISKEKIEISYFLTHEIWVQMATFIFLFLLIERIIVPLVL